jgi:hypothetical protein
LQKTAVPVEKQVDVFISHRYSLLPGTARAAIGMNGSRILLNIVFWIVFSVFFDFFSNLLLPDLALDAQLFLWFFALVAGTILFNVLWFRIRRY